MLYNFNKLNLKIKQSFIYTYFSGYFTKTILMMIAYVCKHSPVWIQPILMGRLIDLASQEIKGRLKLFLLYTGAMISILIVHPFLHTLYVRLQSEIARTTSLNLRIKICRQIQQLSLLLYYRTRPGRFHSKLIRDIETIEMLPDMLTESFVTALVSIIIVIVVTAIRAPNALLLFLVLVPVAVTVRRIFRDRIRENARMLRQSVEEMSAGLSDMITMVPITRAHGLEEKEITTVTEKFKNVYNKGMLHDILNARFISIGWASFMICQTLFLALSVYMCIKKMITTGDIVMLNAFFASLSGSIMILMRMIPQMSKIKEAMHSLNEIINVPDIEYNEGKKRLQKVKGTVEFINVSYNYPSSKYPAVSNLSFKIESGQSVGFVGPSGCGKTTILFLILGFIRPSSGKILIDGYDINEIDLRSFREHVGIVTQEPIFFSGTIKDNITYGSKEISDNEVLNILKLANALEFVQQLPSGIYTRFGEEGINLSGGQKQRLAIARAIIRNPSVLILDEATSNLDVESENLIHKSLDTVMHNQTTIVVSHRLSLVRNVDKIYVLDKGKIEDSGSHEELMKYENLYSLFYRQTFF